MKNKMYIILLITLSITLVGCGNQKNISEKPIDEPTPTPQETTTTDEFRNFYETELEDVTGGKARGLATTIFRDNETFHGVMAIDLPELKNDYFYEGWLVKKSPFEFFSTGEMTFDENKQSWNLSYTVEGDKTDYTQVVITLEPDDGDPAPAAHILEGEFYKAKK